MTWLVQRCAHEVTYQNNARWKLCIVRTRDCASKALRLAAENISCPTLIVSSAKNHTRSRFGTITTPGITRARSKRKKLNYARQKKVGVKMRDAKGCADIDRALTTRITINRAKALETATTTWL